MNQYRVTANYADGEDGPESHLVWVGAAETSEEAVSAAARAMARDEAPCHDAPLVATGVTRDVPALATLLLKTGLAANVPALRAQVTEIIGNGKTDIESPKAWGPTYDALLQLCVEFARTGIRGAGELDTDPFFFAAFAALGGTR